MCPNPKSAGHPERPIAASELVRLVADGLPGPFLVLRSSDGRILHWNRDLERLANITPEDIAHSPALELIAPEDRDRAREAMREALARGRAECDVAFITTRGERLMHCCMWREVMLDSESCICAMGLDITENQLGTLLSTLRACVLDGIAQEAPLATTLRALERGVERLYPGIRTGFIVDMKSDEASTDEDRGTQEQDNPLDDVKWPIEGAPATLDQAKLSRLGFAGAEAGYVYPMVSRKGDRQGALVIAGWQEAGREFPEHVVAHETARLAAIAIEQHHLAVQLSWQARHDALTGLPNRTLLHDRIDLALARGRREGETTAVLLLDLDDFKAINDRFGHAGGDHLLEQMGARLRSCLRTQETVARLGGDEFAVVLPNTTVDETAHVAQKLISVLHDPLPIYGEETTIAPSIGISIHPGDGETVGDLLQAADNAMYEAKEAGKGRYRFYAESVNDEVSARLRLEQELRATLRNGGLELHFQPRVMLDSGQVIGGEGLLRWRHPERGLLLPDRFLGLCDQASLTSSIDHWALSEACQQGRDWRLHGRDCMVSVNLFAGDLASEEFIGRITESLREIPTGGLEIEVNEQTIFADPTTAIDHLRRLKSDVPGLRIALDDFGRGSSMLSTLPELPIDTLKIDPRFIHDLNGSGNGRKRAVVRGMVELGRDLGLEVLAEGVENEDQHRAAVALGCHTAQGYLFSPAVAPAEFEMYFDRRFTPPPSRRD